MISTTLSHVTILLLLILSFLGSLSFAAPHNLRPGPIHPPPGLPEPPNRAHNPSDISPPVWVGHGWRTKNLAHHPDTPPDYSSLKYPVLSLNSEDLHHSVTGFSSKHSCTTKAGKLFHINGVPMAIRGDDAEALYPKGFASWVGQNLRKDEDRKEPQYLSKDENGRPVLYSNSTASSSSSSPAGQPKAGIAGYTMNAQPQNIGYTSECISVSSNGLSLGSLLLSTARPYVDPLTFSLLHPEYIPPHYDSRKPYNHLLRYSSFNLPPNTIHIPPTQAALWMGEGCKGAPDAWSRTPNPSGVDGVNGGGVPKGKAGGKGGPNGWAEHCVVIPNVDLGMGEVGRGMVGKVGRRGGWRSMRVWYGSAEVPKEMLGAGSQSVDTVNVEDERREQMRKLPSALRKKWKGQKKGGK